MCVICPTVSMFPINRAEYQNPFSTHNAYLFLRHLSCRKIKNIINGHINRRKLSFCTAPNSQFLVMESRASLSWQLSVQYQQNGIRQLPSHPVSSQFLRTVTKGGNNCIKTSDHTRSKIWTLRNYLSNIHMHVVILWWQLATLWLHQLLFSITC